jgi:mevalonate kinase
VISSKEIINTNACGKVILVGEHSVVYGSHAVAVPLKNHKLNLTIKPQDCFFNHQPKINALLKKTFKLLNVEEFPLKIETTSQIESGTGLGSSAALCIATLKAISQINNQHIPKKKLAYLANKLEKNFHYNPSGIDTTVIVQETPVLFSPNNPYQKITINNIKHNNKRYPWPFVLINSKEKSPTWKMIEIAKPYFKSPEGLQSIKQIDTISQQTAQGLDKGDINTVAKNINACGKILSASGIVTTTLEKIINKAFDFNALAAKSTGGGGGGFVLALLNPLDFEQQIANFENYFGKKNIKTLLM